MQHEIRIRGYSKAAFDYISLNAINYTRTSFVAGQLCPG